MARDRGATSKSATRCGGRSAIRSTGRSVSIRPPVATSSAASASASRPEPPSGNGQPACADPSMTSAAAPLTGSVSDRIECAPPRRRGLEPGRPGTGARAGLSIGSPSSRSGPGARFEAATAERGTARGCRAAARATANQRLECPPVRVGVGTESSRGRVDIAFDQHRRPSSSGWPTLYGGSTQRRPCRARSRPAKNGEVLPKGWIALHTSWMTPGSVRSAERMPPPTASARSRSVTGRPARASSIAAARPFGPPPTTTASGAFIRRRAGGPARRSPRPARGSTSGRTRGAPAMT